MLLPSDKPSLVCSRCFQLFSPPSPSSSAPRKDSLSSQYHLDLSELHDMSLLNDTNNPSLSLYNTSISSSFDSLSQRSSDGLGLVCGRQSLIFDLSSCSIIHAKQEYPVITQFNYDFQWRNLMSWLSTGIQYLIWKLWNSVEVSTIDYIYQNKSDIHTYELINQLQNHTICIVFYDNHTMD